MKDAGDEQRNFVSDSDTASEKPLNEISTDSNMEIGSRALRLPVRLLWERSKLKHGLAYFTRKLPG